MTREEAIKILTQYIDYDAETPDYYEMEKVCKMAIKALEQEPCEDAISRKDAINAIKRTVATEQIKELKRLPSVQPKPKTGHWEWVQYDYNPKLGDWHCSECRSVVVECVSKEEKGGIPLYKYCPQCGAKMLPTDAEKEWLPQYEGEWVTEKE